MEEHLPFAVEHRFRQPQAGRIARHARGDMVRALWDRRSLS
jgi:hypothetical protein